MSQNTGLAVISVTDKTGAVDLASALNELGIPVVSTGGTYKTIKAGGANCIKVETVTGVGEFLDGRVKTINHKIAAGILARRSKPEHIQQLKRRNIRPVDIVVANLYDFQNAIADPETTLEEAVEKIDIGGVVLLRAAAKNFLDGAVVICDPADYVELVFALKHGGPSEEQRLRWAEKAFEMTAVYDTVISRYLCEKLGIPFQPMLFMPVHELRKAENNDQSPAWLCKDLLAPDDALAWDRWAIINSNPGYVNICGGDSALRVMCRLAEACRKEWDEVPYIAIACKHGNPCGLGVSWNSGNEAIERCMAGDKDAVMGAEVMVNFAVKAEEATRISMVMKSLREKVGRNQWGPDVVFAPEYSESAETILTVRDNRILMVNPALADPFMDPAEREKRPVRGGAVMQKAASFILAFDKDCNLSDDEKLTQLIAWVVAWEGVSNSIALAKDLMLIGTGLGQQDRRGATKLAIMRANDAGHNINGAFFGSDGFFPFAVSGDVMQPEAIEMLQDIGCKGGVVPADGKRLQEVIDYAAKWNLKVIFIPPDHRGFRKH